MASIVIARADLPSAAVLTPSSQASASLGVGNLLTLNPRQKWRTVNLTVSVVVDLGAALARNTVAMLYSNATSAATWQVRAATSEANLTASPGYDSGSLSHFPGGADLSTWEETHARLHIGSDQTFRWWRVDVTDAANPDGYYEAGRIVIADRFQPEFSATRVEPIFSEPAVRTKSQAGGVTPRAQTKRRGVRFTVFAMSEAEAFGSLSPLYRDAGSSRAVLVDINPAEVAYPMDHLYYGLMAADRPLPNLFTGRYSADFEIEEP